MTHLPTPHSSILNIRPYVGGMSQVKGMDRIIKLSSNENPIGPSPKAITAYSRASDSLHRYPDSSYAALRQAIAGVHHLDPNRIVCGAGSDEIIGMLVHAYAGVGDEVLYPEHGFLMYKIYAQAYGATPVTAPETDLRTDVDALLAAVTDKTKIVFLANPNNPTGSYISGEEMERLREQLPSHVLLVIDAAYSEYIDAGDYCDGMGLARSTPNTVVTRTFSKIYGLGALRLGWCYADDAIIDILNRVRSPFNVSAASAAAGIAAIEDVDYTREMKAHNDEWLVNVSDALTNLDLHVYPSAGNFVCVHFPEAPGRTASEVNHELMNRGIIPREIANYGLPDCLRISIGTEEENRAMMAAMEEILS